MTDYHRPDRLDSPGSMIAEQPRYNPEETNRARQAAEALFAPKRRIIESPASATGPSADQPGRKPRILSAIQTRPTNVEPAEVPVDPIQQTANVPASHIRRIRTWLRYGMTVAQVAKMYGVTIGDIKHMLRRA